MKTKAKQDTQISKEAFLDAKYALAVMPDGDDEEPGFIAKAAELPGLLGYGSTEAEAIADFHDVKEDWFDSAVEMNIPVLLPKADIAAEYSGKFVVRMSPELHQTVSQLAESSELSLNSYIVQTLREHVARPGVLEELKAAIETSVKQSIQRELQKSKTNIKSRVPNKLEKERKMPL